MSIYADAKRHFYADIVQHGIAQVDDLRRVYPLGCAVPDKYLLRWLRKFTELPCEPVLHGQRRFINHYKLGADPEFVFCHAYDNSRVDAEALGLKTGQAFGADNNGRLVEVRPTPSRSALHVIASTLEEMRWLALMHPDTRRLAWRAGAYQFRDGLGGHVHLGRKRPSRSAEVEALDQLAEAMLAIGIFPKAENEKRRAGDNFGQRYGLPGDIRLQVHGYEYRVFPSWLDSPLTAFLSLVLAKLVVYDPTLLPAPRDRRPEVQRQRLLNLLAFYKGIDDDALLALKAVQLHGWPQHIGVDFRNRWGLHYDEGVPRPDIDYIPDSIKASPRTLQELFEHLTEKKPLEPIIPEPSWAPYKVPKDYYLVLSSYDTTHQQGMGELFTNIVGSRKQPVQIATIDSEQLFCLTPELHRVMPKGYQQMFGEIAGRPVSIGTWNQHGFGIRVGRPWRSWHGGPGDRPDPTLMAKARKALLSGAFPLWDMKNLKADAYEGWLKAHQALPSAKPASNEILFQGEY